MARSHNWVLQLGPGMGHLFVGAAHGRDSYDEQLTSIGALPGGAGAA